MPRQRLPILDDRKPIRFELRLSAEPLATSIGVHGGRIVRSVFDGDVHNLVVHVPPS